MIPSRPGQETQISRKDYENETPHRTQLLWTFFVGLGLLVSAWLQTSSIGGAARETSPTAAKNLLPNGRRSLATEVAPEPFKTPQNSKDLVEAP
ncbi:MAG: hypothetical protein JNL01_01480 [Bdellovibrionales bacterium]|nr:hypothetical protein [Bdellovibrionales bacterium]